MLPLWPLLIKWLRATLLILSICPSVLLSVFFHLWNTILSILLFKVRLFAAAHVLPVDTFLWLLRWTHLQFCSFLLSRYFSFCLFFWCFWHCSHITRCSVINFSLCSLPGLTSKSILGECIRRKFFSLCTMNSKWILKIALVRPSMCLHSYSLMLIAFLIENFMKTSYFKSLGNSWSTESWEQTI